MKTIQVLFACFLLFSITNAQTKTTTVKTSAFKVWGNCGMCKKTIEGAAKNSGAVYANWNVNSKMLTIKYIPSKTSVDKIQKGVAEAGYDNIRYTGNDQAYEGLDECCKYNRKAAVDTNATKNSCCVKDRKGSNCKECCTKTDGKTDCCVKADGCCAKTKCEKGKGCCKKEGVGKADCCKG